MQIHRNKVKKFLCFGLFWCLYTTYVMLFLDDPLMFFFGEPTFEGVSFAKWKWYMIWDLHSSGILHGVEWLKNSWPLQTGPIVPKWLSRITTLCYILSQKSRDLIYIAAEAWIHAWYIICSGRNVAFSLLCHKCLKTQVVFSAGSWNL